MSAVLVRPEKSGKIPLLGHFSALKDPRQRAKVMFPLPEIMLLVLAATIAGAGDLVEVHEWSLEHLEFLRSCLPFRDDIPSHGTLADVLNAFDQELFKTCFMGWVEDLRDSDPDVIAIDGKTSRRTHDRGRDRKPLHLVSAGRAASGWCSVSRQPKRSPMKPPLFRSCWIACISKVPS
jgi:DDE_Tnp_1-associated